MILEYKSFSLEKFLCFLSLSLLSAVSGFFTFYIESVGIRLSFVSLFLVISGWIFGPFAGVFNGLLSNLSSLSGFYPSSVLFFLQPLVIGFISGVFGLLHRRFNFLEIKKISLIWFSLVVFVCGLGAFAFLKNPFVIFSILLFLAINGGLFFWLSGKKSSIVILYLNLLMTFLSTAVLVSFVMGTVASLNLYPHLDFYFVLSSRIFKEVFKIFLFIIPSTFVIYSLKGYAW